MTIIFRVYQKKDAQANDLIQQSLRNMILQNGFGLKLYKKHLPKLTAGAFLGPYREVVRTMRPKGVKKYYLEGGAGYTSLIFILTA